ncbi:MAG: MoxR family ATPase [Gammaproteobacteria bacterium]|nr:MoxR family ATPase [Gammaproteobacteria bacterium]
MNSNELLSAIIDQASGILLGKQQAIRLSLCTLLSKGHLLIEDLPGVGKTTLAHLLGQLIGLDFQRIQFTSDLLPADILGVSIYERNSESFIFHQGPVFSQLLLADEVNRATPKTQSALLEAMEEKQVTIDGNTHQLPKPFFVIATQNPATQIGTFPLPESQLDRFLMCIHIGYPDMDSERALLEGDDRREMLTSIKPVISPEQFISLQKQASDIYVSPALLDYCQAILKYTRQNNLFRHGLSPRAGLALLNAAKSWAMIENRSEVIPEDLQAVIPAVVNHRLILQQDVSFDDAGQQILEHVVIP